jgi:four helix bundle protein
MVVPVPVPVPVPEVFDLPFDHERLDVDRVALDFIVLADDTIAQLPGGRSHLADPLHRAATAIVLPLAEGAGTFSKPDKRRYDLSAAGSATECAARVDVVQRLRLVPTERHTEAKARLERIASRVIQLAKSLQAPPEGRKNGNGNGNGKGEDSDAKRDLHPTQIGSPAYAAPEQLGALVRTLAANQGITISAGVSPATDIWAVGLVAHELLTGRAAYQAHSEQCEQQGQAGQRRAARHFIQKNQGS